MIFITMEVKKESEHVSPDQNLDTMTEGPLKLRYKWTLRCCYLCFTLRVNTCSRLHNYYWNFWPLLITYLGLLIRRIHILNVILPAVPIFLSSFLTLTTNPYICWSLVWLYHFLESQHVTMRAVWEKFCVSVALVLLALWTMIREN